jgi:DNA-binding CsgD family transcriptional regulator
MNTDSGNLYISMADLEQLGTVQSIDAFTAEMERLTHALSMQHFVVVRFVGPVLPAVAQFAHNAPAASFDQIDDVEQLGKWPVISAMRDGMRPLVFGSSHDPRSLPDGPAGFRTGVAVARVERRGRTVVVMGMAGPEPDLQTLGRVTGMATVVSNYASMSLERLHLAACPFSERQLECMRYAFANYSAKETAKLLGVSFRTVEEYLARARERFGVQTSAAAAWRALDNGWITLQEIQKLQAA